jgi:hypothetical protein
MSFRRGTTSGSGAPPAGGQFAKNRATRGRFIEMEGLRVRSETGKSTKGTAGAYNM